MQDTEREAFLKARRLAAEKRYDLNDNVPPSDYRNGFKDAWQSARAPLLADLASAVEALEKADDDIASIMTIVQPPEVYHKLWDVTARIRNVLVSRLSAYSRKTEKGDV